MTPRPGIYFDITHFIDLESDGLLAVIDLKSKNRENFASQVVFNQTGDSLLIADSRT